MKDDRADLDLTKQIEEKDELIKALRQRIRELLAINTSHQGLMGKQIVENNELKEDNKKLAKQIDDFYSVRLDSTRNSGM